MFQAVPVTYTKLEKFLANPNWCQESRYDARKNLNALYHFLYQRKFLPKDLVEFPTIRRANKLRRVLSREELLSLWPHCHTFLEKCILTTLLDTKCRRGELLSMTRENIFPDHALVTGKVGQREVPLSFDTYVLLCELATSGPLFTINGRLMHKETLYKMVHALMLRAGLTGEKLGAHILRHSAAVESVMEGEDLQTLQQELGHTTPVMTAHYARLANTQVRSKHQALNIISKLTPLPQFPPASTRIDEKTSSPPRVGVVIRALSLDEALEKLKGGQHGDDKSSLREVPQGVAEVHEQSVHAGA